MACVGIPASVFNALSLKAHALCRRALFIGCPSLMVLRLNTCGGVSDLGFADVSSRLTCLRELDIKSSLATDSGLAKLCATERHQGALHVLSVAHCRKITPQGD